jgi:general secretion pathway protein J
VESELNLIDPEIKNDDAKNGKQKSDRGFTLIEILIAIFIFAIVLTTIFGSYRSVLNNAEGIDVQARVYEMVQNCMHRMILDLQSIHTTATPQYSSPDFDDPPDPYRIVGDTSTAGGIDFSRLRFTSFSHTPIGKNRGMGIAEIVYYVQLEGESNFTLKRSDRLYPYEPFEEKKSDPVLCEHVKSVIFKYFDQEGTEYESWDSDSDEFKYATPRAVGIQLEIENDAGPVFLETKVALPVYRNKRG